MKRFLIVTVVLLIGVALLSYPYISNYLIERNGSSAIRDLETELSEQTDEQIEEQRILAEEYNANLSGSGLKDPFIEGSGSAQPGNYEEILDYGNKIMGYIEIPKIDVYLPIYHGVSDNVLSRGVGHMSQSAFPIGGMGNHAVLTGHTALPSAKLFTDLTELKEGDTFYINILNETLAYEVDQINIVKPEDTEKLRPVAGEDHVTLITCTPYAVNSHRLLVRGKRVPYTEEQHQEEIKDGGLLLRGFDRKAMLYGAIEASVLLILTVFILLIRRRKRKKETQQTIDRPE